MIINSEDLRETLKAFQPFSAYERNKRLSNSHFDAPIWEDKVRIDISHNLKLMNHIKDICKSQDKYDSEKVNSLIADTENVMTIHEMCQYAQKSEILKVDVQL